QRAAAEPCADDRVETVVAADVEHPVQLSARHVLRPGTVLRRQVPEILRDAFRRARKRAHRVALAALEHEDLARPFLGCPARGDCAAETRADYDGLILKFTHAAAPRF